MKEVWKETASRGAILQDLSGAFKDAPPTSSSFTLPFPPQIPHFNLSSSAHHKTISKKMIKNRESAARSRARKQAYTSELELEVTQLMEENSELRRKYEELRVEMAGQLPAKRTVLQRTLSAPY